MTKKQRMRFEIDLAISANPVGAGRTADLLEIRQKYGIGRLSTRTIDAVTRHRSYPEN